MVLVAVLLVFHAEVMLMPGAKRSTQVPRLAQLGLRSLLSTAETVTASGTRAGDWVQASSANSPRKPLPAAIAYVTPPAIEFFTAVSSAASAPPPRLMLATAGNTLFAVTQSM